MITPLAVIAFAYLYSQAFFFFLVGVDSVREIQTWDLSQSAKRAFYLYILPLLIAAVVISVATTDGGLKAKWINVKDLLNEAVAEYQSL